MARLVRFLVLWLLALLLLTGIPLGAERLARSWLQSHLSQQLGQPLHIDQLRLSVSPPGVVLDAVRWGNHVVSQRVLLRPGHSATRPGVRHVVLERPVVKLTGQPAGATVAPRAHTNSSSARLSRSLTELHRRVDLRIRDGSLLVRRPLGGELVHLSAKGLFARRSGEHYRLVVAPAELSWGRLLRARIDAISFDISTADWRPVRLAALTAQLQLPGAGGTRLEASRIDGRWRPDGALEISAQLMADEGAGRARVNVRAGANPAELQLEVVLDAFPLQPFASLLARLGVDPLLARASGRLVVRKSAAKWQLSGALELSQLLLRHPLVSQRTLGPFDTGLQFELSVDGQQRDWRLASLRLTRGDLSLLAKGQAVFGAGKRYISANVDVPRLGCQRLLAALPRGFAPSLAGMALRGEVGLRSRLELEGQRFDNGVVEVALEPMSCRVLVDPSGADVNSLNGELTVRVRDHRGHPVSWQLGASNPHYRSLSRISPYVRSAFVTSEDARFFAHHGFDQAQLRRAFLFDLQQGRVARGASTISQQLVKNVFLTHARTLSRKFQEAVLTWRLEQVVSKRRILQSYLNLLELGPGIYGVERAAQRYFGRSAAQLNPLQAAHLAALTPSPRPLARRFSRESPGPSWFERLRKQLRELRRSGQIDAATEQRWANAKLGLLPYQLE